MWKGFRSRKKCWRYSTNLFCWCSEHTNLDRFSLMIELFIYADSCRYHPGVPYFHDAYKGWSCCKKKSVDFTEFLNIKGCEVSKHSNQKPPEPEKPKQDVVVEEPPPMPAPVVNSSLERVDFNSPLTLIQPTVAPALKQTIDNIGPSVEKTVLTDSRYWCLSN